MLNYLHLEDQPLTVHLYSHSPLRTFPPLPLRILNPSPVNTGTSLLISFQIRSGQWRALEERCYQTDERRERGARALQSFEPRLYELRQHQTWIKSTNLDPGWPGRRATYSSVERGVFRPFGGGGVGRLETQRGRGRGTNEGTEETAVQKGFSRKQPFPIYLWVMRGIWDNEWVISMCQWKSIHERMVRQVFFFFFACSACHRQLLKSLTFSTASEMLNCTLFTIYLPSEAPAFGALITRAYPEVQYIQTRSVTLNLLPRDRTWILWQQCCSWPSLTVYSIYNSATFCIPSCLLSSVLNGTWPFFIYFFI